MTYNQDLEERIDRILDGSRDIVKKRMFGGIGYLYQGNMCFGIYKESLVLRISHEKAEELLKNEYFADFDITGKPMKGWVLVSPDILETDDRLTAMIELGIDFAKTLTKKK